MRLFISYSRDDKAWVKELWFALQKRGHNVWFDEHIPPAQDWWDTILTNVETCDTFIYTMTPKSVESIYCRAELDYALAHRKPILPLMLKPCENPAELRRIQYFTVGKDDTLTDVLLTIADALAEIRVDMAQGKYLAPIPRPLRPSEPKPSQQQIAEVYWLAEEVSETNFSLAEAKFLQVIEIDGDGFYGSAAKERLRVLRFERSREANYQSIKQRTENPAGRRGAAVLWRQFVIRYPNYDPDGVGTLLNPELEHIDRLPMDVYDAKPLTLPPIPKRVPVDDILPGPFAWVEIPAGEVTLLNDWDDNSAVYLIKGKPQTFKVPAFAIAKYPVTNAQFAKFIDSGGYNQKKWWTKEGWKARESSQWREPRYWQDKRWKGAEFPVVGVSWYEAFAFCIWLREASGERILLPTEQQWQRAAQGDDGREYPWGSDWDCNRCNNSVRPCDSNQTSPVMQYEGEKKGDSYFGVTDMAGNVWEWCLTGYETGKININGPDVRVVRGGSWDYLDADYFRVFLRSGDYPVVSVNYRGFRLARS